MTTPNTNKRKRVVLTIDDKLDVCEMVKQKTPKKMIMEKYNIGKSTLNDICRKEENLKDFKMTKLSLGVTTTSKQMRTGSFNKLDKALFIWLQQQCELGLNISGPDLLEKAKELHFSLYGESAQPFNASSGFQWRFCNRYGIRALSVFHDNPFSAVDLVGDIIKGYSLDQIFNCDDTNLYYRELPASCPPSLPELTSHKSKESLTINVCSNASGSIKIPLLVVGKSKNPQCFHGTDLPVLYRCQKNGSITGSIFKDWFKNCFVPEVREKLQSLKQEPTAILFLDNRPSHPSEEELTSDDGLIKAKFLPSNVTPLIQPFNQGILESIKQFYGYSILDNFVSYSNHSVSDFLKSVDLLMVVKAAATAWDNINPASLRESWKKLIPKIPKWQISIPSSIQDESGDGDEAPGKSVQILIGPESSTHIDDQQSIVDLKSYDETERKGGIVNSDEQGITVKLSDDDGVSQVLQSSAESRISSTQAAQGMDQFLKWYMHQPEATHSGAEKLREFYRLAVDKATMKAENQCQ